MMKFSKVNNKLANWKINALAYWLLHILQRAQLHRLPTGNGHHQ